MSTIKIRRGVNASLPAGGTVAGEPRFSTDTGQLYIDDGTNNVEITPNATNVNAAGAVMDGDFSSNGLMKRTAAGTYSVATAPTGTVVGTSDSQTLTNKTIAAGSNTISGIANSNLTTTAGDIGGAWATYTPTLTGITLGDGTLTGRYMQVGKTVHMYAQLLFGSTTSITSFPRFDLPVTANSVYSIMTGTPIGNAIFHRGSMYFGRLVIYNSTTNALIRLDGISGAYSILTSPTSTVPGTWTTGDRIIATGTYEAA